MRKATRGLITACAGLVAGAAFGAGPAMAAPDWIPTGRALGYYDTFGACNSYASSLSLWADDYDCGYWPRRAYQPYALITQRPVLISQPVIISEPVLVTEPGGDDWEDDEPAAGPGRPAPDTDAPDTDEPDTDGPDTDEPDTDEPGPLAKPAVEDPRGAKSYAKPKATHKAGKAHKSEKPKAAAANKRPKAMMDEPAGDSEPASDDDCSSSCDDDMAATVVSTSIIAQPYAVGGPVWRGSGPCPW